MPARTHENHKSSGKTETLNENFIIRGMKAYLAKCVHQPEETLEKTARSEADLSHASCKG